MGRIKKLLMGVTNRSSYNKVKTIIRNLPNGVEPFLLLGNSLWLYKYGEVHRLIHEDFPDIGVFKASMAVEGDDLNKMPKSVGVGCVEVATIVDHLRPDLMLTVADRYETLATATVAAYCNIPLIHLQGGEISGTIDDKVRNTITQLADYHFPATYEAYRRVREMLCRGSIMPGDDAQHTETDKDIWNYGCPAMDLMIGMKGMPFLREARYGKWTFNDYKETHVDVMSQAFDVLNSVGHGDILTCQQPYIMIMLHPDTVYPIEEEMLENFFHMMNSYDYPKIVFWNNIDPGGEKIAKEIRIAERYLKHPVRYVRHIEPEVFGALLYNTSLLIGNSSAGIREATFMGTPSISIGQRQEGREHGKNVRIIRWQLSKVRDAIKEMIDQPGIPSAMYGNGDAGQKIALQIGEICDEI